VGDLIKKTKHGGGRGFAAVERPDRGGDALALGNASGPLQTNQTILSRGAWSTLAGKNRGRVAAYHAAYPLRAGMSREELKSKLGLAARLFQ